MITLTDREKLALRDRFKKALGRDLLSLDLYLPAVASEFRDYGIPLGVVSSHEFKLDILFHMFLYFEAIYNRESYVTSRSSGDVSESFDAREIAGLANKSARLHLGSALSFLGISLSDNFYGLVVS